MSYDNFIEYWDTEGIANLEKLNGNIIGDILYEEDNREEKSKNVIDVMHILGNYNYDIDEEGYLKQKGSLSGIVAIPNGISKIGSRGFYNQKEITEIILPEGLDTIGEYCFSGCESLEKLIIPEGV